MPESSAATLPLLPVLVTGLLLVVGNAVTGGLAIRQARINRASAQDAAKIAADGVVKAAEVGAEVSLAETLLKEVQALRAENRQYAKQMQEQASLLTQARTDLVLTNEYLGRIMHAWERLAPDVLKQVIAEHGDPPLALSHAKRNASDAAEAQRAQGKIINETSRSANSSVGGSGHAAANMASDHRRGGGVAPSGAHAQ